MPHLKTLVERHQNDDFVLIGINHRDSPEDFRKGVDEHGVNWLSAYQGATSPISALFNVTGYPTYLVIDVDGTIAYRGHPNSFDGVVADLLEKAKQTPDEGDSGDEDKKKGDDEKGGDEIGTW